MSRAWAIAALGVSLGGCLDVNQPPPSAPRWQGDVEAILGARCLPCHGSGMTPPDLGRFTGVADCRADGLPWALGGDPMAPLLRALDRPDHTGVATAPERAEIQRWIGAGLTFRSTLAHPAGWASPQLAGTDHGAFLRSRSFAPIFDKAAPDACARCHDAPSAAGGAVACTTCHAAGFEDQSCGSCHGDGRDPRPARRPCDSPERQTSADLHAVHASAGARGFPAIACDLCHLVPERIAEPGHARDPSGRAAVRLDTARLGQATYDRDRRSCAVPTCHFDQRPTWTSSAGVGRCDRCHGAPPADPNHANPRCEQCHVGAVDARGQPLAATHLDGKVQVGARCDACHGAEPSPALPGRPAGAHAAHLAGSASAAPIACATCHPVPAAIDSPGHIDHDLPAVVVLSGAAATVGERPGPSWDAARGRCSNVGCHGAALDGGAAMTPTWSSSTALGCGGCHGLPPRTTRGGAGVHPPTGPGDCGACHRTRDGAPITLGLTITAEGREAHVDGCVDLTAGCAP